MDQPTRRDGSADAPGPAAETGITDQQDAILHEIDRAERGRHEHDGPASAPIRDHTDDIYD